MFEASWWVKVYGQSPNPPVRSADIYLALTLSRAFSWGLGVQNRIVALKAFLYKGGYKCVDNEGTRCQHITGVAGTQYELPLVLLKNISQKRGHSRWVVMDE